MTERAAVMKTLIVIIVLVAIGAGVYFMWRSGRAVAGPNGGNVVALQDGTTNAELIADPNTGGLLVHTWDKALRQPRPISAQLLTIGDGQHSSELKAYPVAGDPPGLSSRFYAHADWARGGSIRRGWIHQPGQANCDREFAWSRSWEAGRSHAAMLSELGAYRDAATAHGPGRRGMERDMHNGPVHD